MRYSQSTTLNPFECGVIRWGWLPVTHSKLLRIFVQFAHTTKMIRFKRKWVNYYINCPSTRTRQYCVTHQHVWNLSCSIVYYRGHITYIHTYQILGRTVDVAVEQMTITTACDRALHRFSLETVVALTHTNYRFGLAAILCVPHSVQRGIVSRLVDLRSNVG